MWALAPSCQRPRVSYPMSDSISCIRRAKENGSENRSEKPAEVGPGFPFRNHGRISSHDQSVLIAVPRAPYGLSVFRSFSSVRWVFATAEPGVDLDRVAEAAEGADRNRVGLIEGAVAFVDAQILTSSRGLC